jgi:uncharacterized membrane protein
VYSALLFLHFVGLALGVGAGFANLTLTVATRDLPPAERAAFMRRASVLTKNGSAGLGLLILTGVGMTLLRGIPATFALGGGAFHAKLALVVVFSGLFGYLQSLLKKARGPSGEAVLGRIPVVGRLALAVSLAIVATAVLAFG